MSGSGRYLLLDRIGVGGMAEVFRARSMSDTGSHSLVAIKRIRPQLAADEGFIRLFLDEAKIAGQLRHENIVRIHELGKLEGTHFLAMEYVFGKDLLELMHELRQRDQIMAPPMAAWILSKVLAGLDYAHRQADDAGRPLGLIHRDVSLQNILLSYEGRVLLIDFGIAKAASRAVQTMEGIIRGKVGYMSPEQIAGESIDHRSDIFAASTCLYEMLTGRRLFFGPDESEVVDRVRHARVEPPSTKNPRVPPELEAIVMRGLSLRREDRWQSAGEMRDALLEWLAAASPSFGTAQLSLVLRAIFSSQIAAQRAHLEQIVAVRDAGVNLEPPTSDPHLLAKDTIVTPMNGVLPPVSSFVSVQDVVSVGGPAQDAAPFELVKQPPAAVSPDLDQFMPEATPAAMRVPVSTPGPRRKKDLAGDTSPEFTPPFLGSEGLLGQAIPKILPPGHSIPDLPVPDPRDFGVSPQEAAKHASDAKAASAPPAARSTPWLLLGLTATIALLLGALGVLAALVATGVLTVQ